jgi:molybdopterin-guanine dinucleotide biosynthesis protein A
VPLGDGWLVDRPIAALREVFGARVGLVGECDPAVAARADRVFPDRYPGLGPAGGILSALEATRGAVFVLAGDLPDITSGAIGAILAFAAARPQAWAVLGQTDRIEPCIGLYRAACTDLLRARITTGAGGRLWDLIDPKHLGRVRIPPGEAVNINEPGHLAARRPGT